MKVMLTTIDNPYDPFEDFKSWFKYDVEHGYNTCGYLSRISCTTDQFTDEENAIEIENAIDEIIEHDFMSIYVKLKK